jgi:hypothetical protein
MNTPFLQGLSQAGDLLTASHVAQHAEEDALEKRAHALQQLEDAIRQRALVAALTKQAGLYSAGGKGALVGGIAGALIGGVRRAMKMKALASSTGKGSAAAAAAKLDRAAKAALKKNPKHIRSAAEHQAGEDVKFLAGRKGLKGKSFRDAPLDHIKLYGGSLGRHAAGWGTAGAAVGHGAEVGLKALKKRKHINLAKKWALPAAATLVGTKVLLD